MKKKQPDLCCSQLSLASAGLKTRLQDRCAPILFVLILVSSGLLWVTIPFRGVSPGQAGLKLFHLLALLSLCTYSLREIRLSMTVMLVWVPIAVGCGIEVFSNKLMVASPVRQFLTAGAMLASGAVLGNRLKYSQLVGCIQIVFLVNAVMMSGLWVHAAITGTKQLAETFLFGHYAGFAVWMGIYCLSFLPRDKSRESVRNYVVSTVIYSWFAGLWVRRISFVVLILVLFIPLLTRKALPKYKTTWLFALVIVVIMIGQISRNVLIDSDSKRHTVISRLEETVEQPNTSNPGARLHMYAQLRKDLPDYSLTQMLIGSGPSYSLRYCLREGRPHGLHNVFLEMFVTCGLLGLAAMVWLMCYLVRDVWTQKGDRLDVVGLSLMAYFVPIGLFFFGFREPYFWFLLGAWNVIRHAEGQGQDVQSI